MKRDLSEAQFQSKAKAAGFAPCGFAGYWDVGHGLSVCRHNGGARRRDQLRYMAKAALTNDLCHELGISPGGAAKGGAT